MRYDVAIYATSLRDDGGFYDRTSRKEGGAERQMALLARALAERSLRVAQIIFPPREPIELSYPVKLVYRPRRVRGGSIIGGALDVLALMRAFAAADADVLVLRSGSPVVGVGALYCKLRRRIFVFSSSNVADFTLETMSGRSKPLYRIGLKHAHAVVVQSNEQRELALKEFPSLARVVHIPSFAEAIDEGNANEAPDAFLWFGRSATYKQPLRYIDLARSVPEARFKMIVTWTEGSSELKAQVLRAAAELPNLELVDPVPHADLLEVMKRSVAAVNTSTFEGMPNSYLEAWACGVPVLTLQFDPDSRVARNHLGVAADGSWDRFVTGARELWRTRSDRGDLSRRVRAYVAANHSIEHVGGRWRELIAELRARA